MARAGRRSRRGGRIRWGAVGALLVGTFTGTLVNAIVNVPVRTIATSFRVPVATATLVVVAFNLSFAVLMPLGGWLGDRLGRRRLYCWAVGTLAVGSIGAMLAPSIGVLVACRVVQGAGTAAVLPAVMGLLGELHSREQAGVVLGLWAGVNGLGRALGAPLGGAIVAGGSWRLIFVPAVPLAAIAVLGALRAVPRSVPSGRPLEWRGALLLTAGCGMLLGAVTAVPGAGAASAVVVGLAVAGVGALVGFVRVSRRAAAPFIDPGLLREPSYVRSSLAAFAQMFCVASGLLAVPLVLTGGGDAVAAAGLVVFALPAAMTAFGPVAGWSVRRVGARRSLRLGAAVLVATQVLLLVLFAGHRAPVGLVVGVLALEGIGAAFVQTPTAVGATRSAAGRVGSGLGLFNLVRFAGASLGSAWVAIAVGGHVADYRSIFVAGAVVAGAGLVGTWAGPDPAGRLATAATAAADAPGAARPPASGAHSELPG